MSLFTCMFVMRYLHCVEVLKSLKSSNPKNSEKPTDDFKFELLAVDGREDPLVAY